MHCRSEGWLTVNNSGRRWTSEDIRSRCPLSPRAEPLPMSFQHPAQTRIERHQVSKPYPSTALAPPSFPSRPGTSILIDCRSEGSLTVDHYARRRRRRKRKQLRRQLIIFDMLPDDVLLEIFNFYVDEDIDGDFDSFKERRRQEWITLAHVCRRWRSVVFQSPHRLNLRLFCTLETPARDIVDIWPPLPLIIQDCYGRISHRNGTSGSNNVVAAFELNDRVYQIRLLNLSSSELEYLTDAVANKPFPELTDLYLGMFQGDFQGDAPGPILPDSFLGGSAPRLRSLVLLRVPFPGLPKLLLSATYLINLDLSFIPRSGYIPPEAMASSLSALTSLEFLCLNFRHPRPRPTLGGRRQPPPLARSILPSLTEIRFKGSREYLEEILARVDAPRLNELDIYFFNQIIFDTPQLFQLISRRPTLRAPENGHIEFSSGAITFRFPSQTPEYTALRVVILCSTSEWQLSSLGQVCTSSLPPLSTLEDLYIFEDQRCPSRWQDNVENMLWLELLHPFGAVKNLYLCEEFISRIALALQELVGERTTEVLPTLENIFLKGFRPSRPLQGGIEKFVAARQLTSHPIAVSRWDMNPEPYKLPYYIY